MTLTSTAAKASTGIPQGGPLSQALAAGGFKITNLGDGTLATDAATFGQLPDGSNGQSAIFVPTAPGWVPSNLGFSAQRAGVSRFVLRKARTVSALMFRTITVGTGNVDVAILSSTGVRLASAGSTAGKKGANTTQTVNLTASVNLVAGTVYYAVLVSDTADGTYAGANFAASAAVGFEQWFGATIGLVETFFKDLGTFPIPDPVTVGTVSGNIGPVMAIV